MAEHVSRFESPDGPEPNDASSWLIALYTDSKHPPVAYYCGFMASPTEPEKTPLPHFAARWVDRYMAFLVLRKLPPTVKGEWRVMAARESQIP